MFRYGFVLSSFLLLIAAGCSQAQKETPQQQGEPAQQQQASPEANTPGTAPARQAEAPATPKAVRPAATRRSHGGASAPVSPQAQAGQGQPSPERSAEVPPVPAPPVSAPPVRYQPPVAPPEPRYAVIPAGSALSVRLQDALDTAVNKEGDGFRVLLDRDMIIGGNVVAPRGSVLQGTLTRVERSGRVQGRAQMSLQLKSLRIGAQSYPIDTNVLSFEAESTRNKDAAKVGIGAGLGAIIGAIAGGGKGAAIGAAAGGGAGGVAVLATRGKELQFEPEHAFSFTLQRDVQVKLQ